MDQSRRNLLTILIFVGFLLGILAGWVLGEGVLPVAQPLADIFLRLLRMAIMPLIITSIISAVVSVGSAKGLGRLGWKTLAYYVTSSMMAIFTGQILVNVLKPGVGAELGLQATPEQLPAAQHGLTDLLLNIIPENPFHAMAEGNVLPVIFFSILFGYFITTLPKEQRIHMGDWFDAAFHAMLRMTMFVVWTAPVGVFGIIARIVAQTGFEAFRSLGFYFLVVLAGLAFHLVVNLPLLLTVAAQVNPVKHYRGMPPALLMGFSTCSTIVTLPFTMEAVTGNSKVSEKVANFVLPIGATMNMDGTALYECVAAIFIAQVYGFHLSLGAQLTVAITALLASIGAASVPMSGMVMLFVVLKAVGLPLEGVGLILAVDRILDMFRTALNVLSDSVGSVIVARLEGESLEGMGTT
ncbi:MAG: dicarboxylate/amino acid:cation symporter [Gemmatimonadota bacterium]|jgi:proton glutamate symport protein